MVEVHESVGRPNPPLQLFPRDNLTRVFQKDLKNLEELLLQFDFHALLAQFARA